MNAYTESQLKTAMACNLLYSMKAELNFLDISQKILLLVLKDLNTLLIKGELVNLDKDLFLIIKRHIYHVYPDILKDDSQTLISYLVNSVYAYLKKFPLKDYTPIYVDLNPVILLNKKNIQLNIDILYRQNNKSGFLHGVSFVNKVSDYSGAYDYFNHLKLQFLKTLFINRRSAHPATRLHICSISPLQYRNKNLKSFLLKTKTLTERDINLTYIKSLDSNLNLVLSNKNPIPIPNCLNYSCPKRKECLGDL